MTEDRDRETDSDPEGLFLAAGTDSHSLGSGADIARAAGSATESVVAGTGFYYVAIGTARPGTGIDIGTCTFPRPTVSSGDRKEGCIQATGSRG